MTWTKKLAIFLPIVLVIVGLDLWSKQWVESFLEHGATHSVWGDVFLLANHRNPGGMWGVGSEWNPWILRAVRLLAVVVILWMLDQAGPRDRFAVVALALVMGGAAGNLYDSFTLGYVRDFLLFDFGVPVFDPFPTFNVADSAICVGVVLLVIQMCISPAPESPGGDRDQHETRTV
jgi:signal peptidase II